MTKPLHQRFVGLRFAVLSGELKKPLAEEGIERFVLGLRERTCLLDEVFLSTQGYIFH